MAGWGRSGWDEWRGNRSGERWGDSGGGSSSGENFPACRTGTRYCRICGCLEPFANRTEECCWQVHGKTCKFDDETAVALDEVGQVAGSAVSRSVDELGQVAGSAASRSVQPRDMQWSSDDNRPRPRRGDWVQARGSAPRSY